VLILGIIVFGFACGLIAQLILGRGGRPTAEALVAGLVGSFVGGLLISLLAGDGLALKPSGFIGSIVGAIIVLAIWYAVRKPTSPAAKGKTNRRR
jgi:uncharacterized membrane protein YeaQ/YmgE (transglycosylase-associated protein family)